MIVNGLCQGGASIDEIVAAARSGGVHATNLTVAVDIGFTETIHAIDAVYQGADRLGVPIATSVADIEAAEANGDSALIIGFQDATPIEGRLDYLRILHRLGLRILQLTYQRRNLLGDGCGEPANGGLSLVGREVVAECNRLGILIDLSHVGFTSTMEAIHASTVPVTFSHINLFALNPIPRNKTDDQIRAVAERGGVIGINAISRLLSPTGRQDGATIDQFIDQIDAVVRIGGIESAAIGLDIYEGLTPEAFEERKKTFLATFPELQAGGEFPLETYWVHGLATAANIPVLADHLSARRYSGDEVDKILGENLHRLYREVWR